MRFVSRVSPTVRGRQRLLGAVALAISLLALAGAQRAAADTSSYIASAQGLGFPANAAANGGTWNLYAQACDGEHSCLAVGDYEDGSGNTEAYVVPIVDGEPGTAQEVTLPADADANPQAQLEGVACVSGDVCEAWGSYNVSGVSTPMVVRISGGTPDAAQELPLSGDISSPGNFFLNQIACASADSCLVVGWGHNSGSDNVPVVVPIIGGVPQAAVSPPLPHGHASTPNSVLNSVACQSSGTCAAVGYYTTSSGAQSGLVVPINAGVAGGGIESQPADGAANPAVNLDWVACPATGACQAVGAYNTNASPSLTKNVVVPIVNGFPGTASAVTPPSSYNSTAAYASIDGLSCASAALCVAAGNDTDASGHQQAAVIPITPNGAAVEQATEPADADPSNPQALFYSEYGNSVGCVADGACLAGGYYSLGHGSLSAAGLVQQVSAAGVPGSALATPAPYDLSSTGYGYGPYAFLYSGVGCLQSGSCVGVGEYDSNAHGFQPYLVDEQAPLRITTTTLAAGTQGSAYQATLTAAGAWGDYSWSLSAGSLPAGLSLNAQGVISGTSTAAGTATFTVQATGSGATQQTAGERLSLAVAAAVTTTTTTTTTTASMSTLEPQLRVLGVTGKVKDNRQGVKLACRQAACRGSVELEASELVTVKHGRRTQRKHVTVVVGRGGYALVAGASGTVEVRLNATGRRLLSAAEHHRLTVKIVVSVIGASAVTRTATFRAASTAARGRDFGHDQRRRTCLAPGDNHGYRRDAAAVGGLARGTLWAAKTHFGTVRA
jgi:hypothetical protein